MSMQKIDWIQNKDQEPIAYFIVIQNETIKK